MYLAVMSSMVIFYRYSVINAYTSEVFPTSVRGIGMGVASSLNRLLGVGAPFFSGYLISINPNVALYLAGSLFGVTGLFAAFLPETKNKFVL
jgi:MFS transporter, putative metabolite:H+ symporter